MGTEGSLIRFVTAQDGVYDTALAELRAGRKRSHWMWFVFPQFAGLGMSATSQHYAIGSLDEAKCYLAHPLLGPRLRECVSVVAASAAPSAEHIFGRIDAVKLRSSMTLFHRADPADATFIAVLDRYFGGRCDERTDALLA